MTVAQILDRAAKAVIIGIAFFLPLSSGVVNALIGAGIIFWILKKVAARNLKIRPTLLNLPLLLLFMASCVSIFNSIDPATSVKGLVKILKYMGIYFLMVENIDDARMLKNTLIALFLGAAVVCIDGIVQYFLGHDLIRGNPLIINLGIKRMTAAYRHCNDFGVYLVTVAGVMWTLALYGSKKTGKLPAFLTAGLVTACIVLTFSRGAAVGFLGAVLLMALIKRDKIILGLLAVVLVLAPFIIPSNAREWVRSTKSPLEAFCNTDRIAFYRSAIQMIKAHPVVGAGINTFSKAYYKYKVKDTDVITADTCYAHNNYLQMAGEIGLVGLGAFLWAVLMLFLELKKIYTGKNSVFLKNAALGLGCGIFAFMLNGLTESSFYFSKIVVVFWFVTGLGVGLKFIKDDHTD